MRAPPGLEGGARTSETKQDGFDFNLAYVDEDFQPELKPDFETAYMNGGRAGCPRVAFAFRP